MHNQEEKRKKEHMKRTMNIEKESTVKKEVKKESTVKKEVKKNDNNEDIERLLLIM
jgi:hypothetical protein